MRKWINKLSTKLGTGKLVAFVAVCLVAVLLVGVSIAWFTSQINLTGSSFSTGTIEFKAYGYNSDGDLVTTIYPEGKIPEGDNTANAPLFSDKDMKAGSVSTAFIAIENSGSLNLEYRLSFSVSEHLDSANDDLVYLGGYWYLLTDVTSLVTGDIKTFAEANKAIPCNSTNCTTASHTCTEKNGSQNLSTISKYSNSGIIDSGSGVKHYYRLDYGVRADASINEYANRKFAVNASVFTSQVGAMDEEVGYGVTRQVTSAEDLDKALEQALPGDTILLLNNITYNGDLIIKKCINFEAGGKVLTVNGNMIYDFVSTLPLKINLQGKGTIKVVASGAVGGNFTINAPKSQVELIGGNTAGDLLVGRLFTVDATNDSDSGGCIFSDIVILDGDGKDAKAVYVRSNTKLTVSSGVTLERIEATVQATNIEIQNAGQINQVLLSSMFQTTQTDAPQIYIHNYNRIFNIVLPTWSVPFVDDGEGNYSGNTRIVVSAGGVIDTLTGSANFNNSHIEDEDANLYVEQIVSGFDTGLRVYYRNLPEQTNTALYDILTYYFVTEKGMTSAQMETAVDAIEKLEIICRGTKTVTASDFTNIRGMASISSLDLSQATLANNTLPQSALFDIVTLEDVVLPRSVTTIGTQALQGTSIKCLTVPATVTSIGNSALAGIPYVYMLSYEPCTYTGSHNNTYFFVPDSVLNVYRNATGWKSFVTRIYSHAQLADDGVTHIRKLNDGSYEIALYTGNGTDLVVGENIMLDGTAINVTSVGENAYRHISQVFKLGFHSSVINISDTAFYQRAVSGAVDFNQVKTIGNQAFYGCNQLLSISENNNIITVGENAFDACYCLYEVVLPKIETVKKAAFTNNSSLVRIVFGDNLKTLEQGQFKLCNKLREVTFKNPNPNDITISQFYINMDTNVVIPNLRIFVPAESFADYYTKFSGFSSGNYKYTLCEDGELYGENKIDVRYNNSIIATIDIGQFRIRNMSDGTVSISSCNVLANDVSATFWDEFNAIPDTINGKSVTRIGPGSYRGVPFAQMSQATDASTNPWGNNNAYIPNSVKEIASHSFRASDISITYLPKVEIVGSYAFENATHLYYIDAPELLTLNDNAFKNVAQLRQFKASKLAYVGSNAFNSCTELIRLYVPNLATPADSSWLEKCDNLVELWVAVNASSAPSSIPSYSTNSKVISLTCAKSTTKKQYKASDVMFANVSDYSVVDGNGKLLCVLEDMPEYWISEDALGGVSILNYFPKTPINSTVNVPSTLTATKNGSQNTFVVTSIGFCAYSGVSFNNNSVSIPSTVLKLEQRAFYNTSSLTSAVNLNNITTVSSSCFMSSGITNVVGNKVTTMSVSAFDSCVLLKTASFPRLTTVSATTFKGCTSLESVYFEDVTTFSSNAFQNASKLKNITINRIIPDGGKIPTWATYNPPLNFEFYVPSQSLALYQASASYNKYPLHTLDTVMLTEDGNYSLINSGGGWEIMGFTPLKAITTLNIPQNYNGKDIVSIKAGAFSLCTTVTTIVLPASYCHYQQGAFNGMTALQNVNVASGSTYFSGVSGVLFSANGKELVYYPSGNTSASYNIPNGTELIQSYAFEGATMLQTLVVPASVTTVGYQAFSESGLITITFAGTTPPYMVDTNIFNTNVDGFTIHVPAGSGDAYKASSGFIKYKDYIVEG